MDIDLLIPLLITSIVVIVGWFIVHWLSSKRDQRNKRRELRVQYLIDAWRNLANVSNREDNSRLSDLESAIADIQLFGNKKQIELAQKFTQDFVNHKTANLDELLFELRQELRQELSLKAVSNKIIHLRIIAKSDLKHKNIQ